MVVDDNAFNREVSKSFLEALGLSVVAEAQNGAEALRAFDQAHEHGAPLDLIVMDVCMPEMDGPTTARLIREHEVARERAMGGDAGGARRVVIVAATGYTAGDEKQRSMDCGMDSYMSKPFSLHSLKAALADLPLVREQAAWGDGPTTHTRAFVEGRV